MIRNKEDLRKYLEEDRVSLNRNRKHPRFDDVIWKFQITLRKYEYYYNTRHILRFLYGLLYRYWSVKLCITIPINVFDEGLAIVHFGSIVVSGNARVGKNCRIHECVCIGATNGNSSAPVLGDNVFISTGAKIIGDISIASGVAIAANAVVVNSLKEEGTTWGGVPAKKISNNDSNQNMIRIM